MNEMKLLVRKAFWLQKAYCWRQNISSMIMYFVVVYFGIDSSLEFLYIDNIDDMISLPDKLLQHVSTLQCLSIDNSSGLTTLPYWIGSLTSLASLSIYDCEHLTERCQREIGDEWHKIAHIPNTKINDCKE